ncbi:hypothetical protein DJ018_14010 [Phenylobacterium deserti]|uniref:SPOR domain-containing protein n=1 Tax=Phenylobacterium deserti TaxID=1914756 RepID=A0A328ADX7_9CAUL|nr:hypothetical protein DJ018_14010 [Phenylobacterium deserti]
MVANVAVQVVGSPDEAEARRVASRAAARRPGLTSEAVRATVNGRIVFRGLVRGFASRAAAGAFCEQLKAAGQACFLR